MHTHTHTYIHTYIYSYICNMDSIYATEKSDCVIAEILKSLCPRARVYEGSRKFWRVCVRVYSLRPTNDAYTFSIRRIRSGTDLDFFVFEKFPTVARANLKSDNTHDLTHLHPTRAHIHARTHCQLQLTYDRRATRFTLKVTGRKHRWIGLRPYIHSSIHTCIHTCIHTYIRHTYIRTYMYDNVYVHTYIRPYIHKYTHTHTHTHTYTRTHVHTFIHNDCAREWVSVSVCVSVYCICAWCARVCMYVCVCIAQGLGGKDHKSDQHMYVCVCVCVCVFVCVCSVFAC